MLDALKASAAGMQSAAAQADIAAQNIIAAARPPSPDSTAEAAELARARAAYQQAAGNSAMPPLARRAFGGRLNASPLSLSGPYDGGENAAPSLEESIVRLKVAAAAYKANAAVFKSINKTLGALLEIKS